MPIPKQKSLKVGSVCSGIEAASASWFPLGYTFSKTSLRLGSGEPNTMNFYNR